jgi:hypothetical protein
VNLRQHQVPTHLLTKWAHAASQRHTYIHFQKINIGIHFDSYAKERISQRECSGECNSIIPSMMDSVPTDLQVRVRLLQEKRTALHVKRMNTSEIEKGF